MYVYESLKILIKQLEIPFNDLNLLFFFFFKKYSLTTEIQKLLFIFFVHS